MKYIDADKLIAEIKRLKERLIQGACAAQIEMETNCKDEAYNEVLSFITSLQQEQPSLPSNLDKAAEEIVKDWNAYGDGEYKKLVIAGAEWLAEQGVSIEIIDETKWADVDTFVHRNCDGATVIQIRKKEE